MRQLILLAVLFALAYAAGRASFTAKDVVITNRPFINGVLEAESMYYDKNNERIAWTYKGIQAGSLSEAYIYDENLRLRKCSDACEAFGEDRNVPDLVSKGGTTAARDGCQTCFNENPNNANGQVDTLCFNGNNICLVEFSSGETWKFNGAITTGSFPNDAFLDSVAEKKKLPGGGGCTDECSQVFDIVLVLDESGSINNNEWNQLKAFAEDLVEAFEVGPTGANFAIKLYSTVGRNLLTMSASKTSILNQLRSITKVSSYTCIGCGIELAYKELQANKRPGTPGIIVTLTDGRNNRPCQLSACGCNSPCANDCCRGKGPVWGPGGTGNCDNCGGRDELIEWTDRARSAGYKMVSIGVGDNLSEDDLKLFTSEWPADYIAVADFASLNQKLQDILTVICPVNTVNDCGASCNGFCHCGQECTCPSSCEPKDKCHTAVCVANAGFGCVQKPITCNDNNACTKDTCNPNTGCVFTDIKSQCNDNSECTDNSCEPAVGCVIKDVTCDPANQCQETSCNPATGCQSTTITDAECERRAASQFQTACWTHTCDNGCKRERVDCSGNDKCKIYECDPVTGCKTTDVDCDKGDPCKVYTCDPAVGCQERPKDCDDGLFCTTDTCNAMTGVCENVNRMCDKCQIVGTGAEVDCDAVFRDELDANKCQATFCDVDGSSNIPTENCRIRDTTPDCNSNSQCIIDTCDITTGECVATPKVCDSGSACIIDGCNPDTGCTTEDVVCDKRNECEVARCDPASGCVFEKLDCNKTDKCLLYSCDNSLGCQNETKCLPPNNCFEALCDPLTGECSFRSLCDDGSNCTIDTCDTTTDPLGVCVNTPINETEVCNDFSGCTRDYCDPTLGCVNEYQECPNFNVTIPCQTGAMCHPTLGCRIANIECTPKDKCHVADCVFYNATDTKAAENVCEQSFVDSTICVLGDAAVTGISIGAGVLAVIIIAVIVALVLASLAAAKAFQVLTADGLASGGAQTSQIFKPDGVEGESQIFA